tara:strand:+ start:452 stop:628 length:177 start_codon:yes stop_codon:yes gene_type:complete
MAKDPDGPRLEDAPQMPKDGDPLEFADNERILLLEAQALRAHKRREEFKENHARKSKP